MAHAWNESQPEVGRSTALERFHGLQIAFCRRRGCAEETAWLPLMGNTSKADLGLVRQVPGTCVCVGGGGGRGSLCICGLCRRGDDRSPEAEEGTGPPGFRVQVLRGVVQSRRVDSLGSAVQRCRCWSCRNGFWIHLKEPFGRLGSQVLGSGGAWGAMAHKSNPYKKAGKWKCTSGDIML